MLAGKGFENVYNVTGGFKGWKGEAAFGEADLGLELFTGHEAPEKTLVIAYSLEEGLLDFYLSMIPRIKNDDVKKIFKKLSEIEIKHQGRIYKEYVKITGSSTNLEEFVKNTVVNAVEGGLTTREYLDLFKPDWDSAADIIALAMSIEAQALDLYLRAADRSDNPESKNVLMQIADEERVHLAQLGKLMDGIT
jgi:rubrerythrin